MKRCDSNQLLIVAALRAAGASVAILAGVGGGVPDLLIGWQGKNYLLEVKNLEGRGDRFTPAELEFMEAWRGQMAIAHNPEQAMEVFEKSEAKR
jgi:hypothetical protein